MKVLVVDDDEHIREMVKINLEMDNFDVETAENGREAVEFAKSYRPDLVLMDVMMPVMNGFKAVQELRKNVLLKDVCIFMMTARSQLDDVRRAIESGADNYITKPFDPVALPDMIYQKLVRSETINNKRLKAKLDDFKLSNQ